MFFLLNNFYYRLLNNFTPRIMNIGASKEVFIEDILNDAGCNYIADRIDIDDCRVLHPSINNV